MTTLLPSLPPADKDIPAERILHRAGDLLELLLQSRGRAAPADRVVILLYPNIEPAELRAEPWVLHWYLVAFLLARPALQDVSTMIICITTWEGGVLGIFPSLQFLTGRLILLLANGLYAGVSALGRNEETAFSPKVTGIAPAPAAPGDPPSLAPSESRPHRSGGTIGKYGHMSPTLPS